MFWLDNAYWVRDFPCAQLKEKKIIKTILHIIIEFACARHAF
jgi:hypothetical protein